MAGLALWAPLSAAPLFAQAPARGTDLHVRAADLSRLRDTVGAILDAGVRDSAFPGAIAVIGIAALVVIHRRPNWFGALAGLGASIKVWPIVLLLGEWDRRRLLRSAAAALGALPPRPPAFCTGCPERPVFSAIKLMQRELGPTHISTDIGCHSFATFAPFSPGNSILGYGMGLASSAGVGPMMARRPVAIMGDGGVWHNGLLSGVASNLLNKGDAVLIVMKNGYTSATGTQDVISKPTDRTIENTLQGLGVGWMKTVNNYHVGDVAETLKDAMTTDHPGLKVVIAEGECQLERQRRIRPHNAAALKAGKRVLRTRFGVDEDVCSGDHSCIRLSGCPSLTVKDATDPLRVDPVAHVNNDCVGCGLCGEVAHAAVLCPSFFRAEIIHNPSRWDRFKDSLRRALIGWLQPA